MNCLFEKKVRKVITVIIWLINIICYFPILYLAPFDRASGDDWGYGIGTHRAWQETGDLFQVIKAACITVKKYYYSWQGTWFSVFLFTFQPEVFSHKAYWIVPIIMMSLTIVSVSLFLYIFLCKKIGATKWDFGLINGIILFLIVQFPVNTKAAIFWYNGTVHYVVPFGLALCSIALSQCYIIDGKKTYIVLISVLMTLLGGMSYLSAFYAPLMILFFVVVYGGKEEKLPILSRRSRMLLIPIILEFIGLIVSAIAPGNKVRGGEQYEVTFGRAVKAIFESFGKGLNGIVMMFRDFPIVIAALILLSVFIWFIIKENEWQFNFKWPGLVILYLFGTYSAMYWPELFAGVGVSGGVPNTIFYVFVINSVVAIVWLIGWFAPKAKSNMHEADDKMKKRDTMITVIALVIVCVMVILGKGNIKKTVAYISFEYIRTGQAADYREQMKEFTSILVESSESEVEVPPINWDQGPFMHMCVTDDKEAWTNSVVAGFFGKDSVIARNKE